MGYTKLPRDKGTTMQANQQRLASLTVVLGPGLGGIQWSGQGIARVDYPGVIGTFADIYLQNPRGETDAVPNIVPISPQGALAADLFTANLQPLPGGDGFAVFLESVDAGGAVPGIGHGFSFSLDAIQATGAYAVQVP